MMKKKKKKNENVHGCWYVHVSVFKCVQVYSCVHNKHNSIYITCSKYKIYEKVSIFSLSSLCRRVALRKGFDSISSLNFNHEYIQFVFRAVKLNHLSLVDVYFSFCHCNFSTNRQFLCIDSFIFRRFEFVPFSFGEM